MFGDGGGGGGIITYTTSNLAVLSVISAITLHSNTPEQHNTVKQGGKWLNDGTQNLLLARQKNKVGSGFFLEFSKILENRSFADVLGKFRERNNNFPLTGFLLPVWNILMQPGDRQYTHTHACTHARTHTRTHTQRSCYNCGLTVAPSTPLSPAAPGYPCSPCRPG